MHPSIPEGSWRVNADDPLALTRLLDLPGLVVTRLEYNDVQESLHLCCTHADAQACCPTCQQSSRQVHDYTRRVVRDLPWAGKPCLLEFAARRFYCQECAGPFREELAWVRRGSRLSQRYRQHLFGLCRRTTIQAVSQEERIGYKTVERLYYALAQEQQPARPPGVRQLGIDEFAVKKGHDQFALALSDLEAGRILALLPDRKKETLMAYFATWTQAQREAVQEVAMDLWEPYAQAVEACLPQARIVADRFHVMKNLTDQVTAARRDLQKTLPEDTKAKLKGCRWLLVRNQTDLTDKDKAKLTAMFAVSSTLQTLHHLKEDFRAIFETERDRDKAASRLQTWIAAVQTSGLTKLDKFVSTLRHRWEHILNYFPNRLSSGKVEGLNNKVKVIKRCAYGFGNFEHFALRILVECDGAP